MKDNVPFGVIDDASTPFITVFFTLTVLNSFAGLSPTKADISSFFVFSL